MTAEPKYRGVVLRPCLFCRQRKSIAVNRCDGGGFTVVCFGCLACGPHCHTKIDAVRRWNAPDGES